MLLQSFLEVLRQYNLDAYINPISDDHFNEIIGPSDDRVKALTGFTGTYGTAITGARNAFFTTVQFTEKARNEIRDYEVIEESPGKIKTWIISQGIKRIGVSSKLIPSKMFIKLFDDLKAANVELVSFTNDLFDIVWKDKPKKEFNEIFNLEAHRFNEYVDLDYVKLFPEMKISNSKGYDLNTIVPGEVYIERLGKLQSQIKEDEGYLISNLSSIGWLTNLRGNDLNFSSAFYSFAYLTKDTLRLWTGKKLDKEGIKSLPYNKFYSDLDEIKEKNIYISGDVNYYIYRKLKNAKYTDLIEIAEELKNKTETFGFKMSGIKDAKAIIQLFTWIENSKEDPTEKQIQKKLIGLKKQNKGYFSESFEPIIASGKNSSKIYHVASDKKHKKDEILLLDTGSHYMHGTTDLTRTVCFGEPTADMIRFYTITLKSLVKAKYIRKNSIQGKELDEASRYYYRKIGKDYITSTGHGVGYFGHVHENVPKMNYEQDTMALYNVFTLEPSYYDADMGIRIEDQVLLNQRDGFVFQTNLSFVPYQINMIDNNMLSEPERRSVNLFSRKMREFLSPLFPKESKEYAFLIKNTEELPNIEQTMDVNGEIYTYKK